MLAGSQPEVEILEETCKKVATCARMTVLFLEGCMSAFLRMICIILRVRGEHWKSERERLRLMEYD